MSAQRWDWHPWRPPSDYFTLKRRPHTAETHRDGDHRRHSSTGRHTPAHTHARKALTEQSSHAAHTPPQTTTRERWSPRGALLDLWHPDSETSLAVGTFVPLPSARLKNAPAPAPDGSCPCRSSSPPAAASWSARRMSARRMTGLESQRA